MHVEMDASACGDGAASLQECPSAAGAALAEVTLQVL